MEISVRLDPADRDRFIGQAVLKAYRRERPVAILEDGVATDASFSYHLKRTTIGLQGQSWRAEMTVEDGGFTSGPLAAPFCLAKFRLLAGEGAPLSALLQILAERIPIIVEFRDLQTIGFDFFRAAPLSPSKSKIPLLTPDCSTNTALQTLARHSLSQFLGNYDCLLQTGHPEAIHQMRVALRRLRSAMGLFKPLSADPQSKLLSIELRWLQQVMGSPRNADVIAAHIMAPVEALFHPVPGYDRLREAIAETQKSERQKLLQQLADVRCRKALLRLACWCAELASRPRQDTDSLGVLAKSTLGRRLRLVARDRKKFASLDDEERHRCRIRVKKLRYAVELFAGLFAAEKVAHLAEPLASLQDRLGSLNDIAMAQEFLQNIACHADSPELAWAAGVVNGWHQNRVGELLAKAMTDWRKVEKRAAFLR